MGFLGKVGANLDMDSPLKPEACFYVCKDHA